MIPIVNDMMSDAYLPEIFARAEKAKRQLSPAQAAACTAKLQAMPYSERMARAQAKQEILLNFLASGEVYTTAEVAGLLLQISRSRAADCLASLERQGALTSEMHLVDSQKRRIFGITSHGLAMADRLDHPYFQLGRTNSSWINHRLDAQKMRIQAESQGWTNWTPERALLLQQIGMKKVPDALATNPTGTRVAVEIERFCKTKKRYAELILAYLQEIKAGLVQEVHYVCPVGIEILVERAFKNVESVKLNGESVKLTDAHRSRFKFFNFDNWPEGV